MAGPLACSDDGDGLDATAGADAGADSGTATADAGPGQDAGPGADAGPGGDAGNVDAGPPDMGMVEPATAVEIPLGSIPLGPDGTTDPVTFDIPAGAQSFMIVVDGDDSASFGVARLDDPNGNAIISDEPVMVSGLEQLFVGPFPSQFKSDNRALPDEGIGAVSVPNNQAVTVTGGTYTVKLLGAVVGNQGITPATGNVDVTVYYKEGDISSGRLDVQLYFSGAGGLSAMSAQTDPFMQDALARLREIYGAAGIEIINVAYHDIDPSFQTIMSLQGPGNDLNEMFKLSEGNGPGLHFFMVDRIQSPLPIGMIGGVAGGLPGPPLAPGTVASGVAVALSATMNDPDVFAHVMGHEGGHWLGLFHTTEFGNFVEDQLDDTPPGDGGMMHLMFPSVGGGQIISPTQAQVMRQHVEVRN